MRDKVRQKLQVVQNRCYIQKGTVKSLTSYFSVPKGEGDIRMVYDASKSGLNKSLWVPSFSLPSVEALTRCMDFESWMGDLDLGDVFLNFPLDVKLQPYCGIDLGPYILAVKAWEHWTRCMMGLKPSPYVTIKAFFIAFKVVLGNRRDSWNITKKMAPSTLVYVDDLQPVGSTAKECWLVMHRTASILTHLGIQVAARKTHPPTTTPGPWAGSVAWSSEEGVCVKSKNEKWTHAQGG